MEKSFALAICGVFIATVWASSNVDPNCDSRYLELCSNHTACLLPNKTCDVKKFYHLNETTKKLILEEHNKRRRLVANGEEPNITSIGAANMKELVWDDELQRMAESWAKQCRFDQETNMDCRKPLNFSCGGQNVYLQTDYNIVAYWKNAVHTWFENEMQGFNKSTINHYKLVPGTGHLTQLIWAESRAIGCAYIAHTNLNLIDNLLICNFGPCGNVLGEKIFIEGKACSECEDSEKCDDGLCSADN